MELTRHQTMESKKEVAAFLKIVDSFKYFRELVEGADSLIDEQSKLVYEAKRIRERAQADAVDVRNSAKAWNESQLKVVESKLDDIQLKHDTLHAECGKAKHVLNDLHAQTQTAQAVLEDVHKKNRQEKLTYERDIKDLQKTIVEMRSTAATLAARFTL